MANVFAGPRARFLINSVPVAYAAGVSGSESVDREPIDVLDLLEVKEFVPVAYRATLSAQVFRVIGQSLKALNIFPTLETILTSGDLTCALQDKITQTTMARFDNVQCSEHSFDVTARGVVSSNISFVCVRVRDESEIGGAL